MLSYCRGSNLRLKYLITLDETSWTNINLTAHSRGSHTSTSLKCVFFWARICSCKKYLCFCLKPHLRANASAVAHPRRAHGVGAHWRADDREGRRQAVHGRAQRADGRVERAGRSHGGRAEERGVHSSVGCGRAQGWGIHLAHGVCLETQITGSVMFTILSLTWFWSLDSFYNLNVVSAWCQSECDPETWTITQTKQTFGLMFGQALPF